MSGARVKASVPLLLRSLFLAIFAQRAKKVNIGLINAYPSFLS